MSIWPTVRFKNWTLFRSTEYILGFCDDEFCNNYCLKKRKKLNSPETLPETVGNNDSNKLNDITAAAQILSVTTKIGVDFGVQDHKFGVQK